MILVGVKTALLNTILFRSLQIDHNKKRRVAFHRGLMLFLAGNAPTKQEVFNSKGANPRRTNRRENVIPLPPNWMAGE